MRAASCEDAREREVRSGISRYDTTKDASAGSLERCDLNEHIRRTTSGGIVKMFQYDCGAEPVDTWDLVGPLALAMLSLTTACIAKVVGTTLTAEPRARYPAVGCVRLGQTLTDSSSDPTPPQSRESSSSGVSATGCDPCRGSIELASFGRLAGPVVSWCWYWMALHSMRVSHPFAVGTPPCEVNHPG